MTNVSFHARPRSVSEAPPDAAAALAAVMPGQIRTVIPLAARWSSSSVERPKIDGSPPLSRTTRLPASAALASKTLIET